MKFTSLIFQIRFLSGKQYVSKNYLLEQVLR